jgi:hypothetical protein
MLFTIGSMADRARETAPEFWGRLLTIFLDGVRAGAALTPMPAPPLRQDQWAAIVTARRA